MEKIIEWLLSRGFNAQPGEQGVAASINILVTPAGNVVAECIRLRSQLEGVHIKTGPFEEPTSKAITGMYDPSEHTSIITLWNVTDADLVERAR